MRPRVALAAALPVLLGPFALSFFSGGYFDAARLWSGAAAWLLVALIAAFRGPRALVPRSGPARLTLLALAALTMWTGLSLTWAPAVEPAADGFEIALLYLGGLTAALALLEPDPARRAAEPVLLAGCLAVAGYALAERLVPGVPAYEVSLAAGDRLFQPLTYWNALGAMCAIGVVLAAGRAARGGRGAWLAAAAAPPLGLALYLTFSRGALGAAVTGLAVLVAVMPDARTLRAALIVAAAGAIPAAATVALPDVATAGGSGGQGVTMLAVLAATMAAAAFATRAWSRPAEPRPRVRHAALAVLAAALLVSVVAAASLERQAPASDGAGRLASVESNRYAYWRVALESLAEHPVIGTGSGGFAVEWLRERELDESVRDAHSLYLETAAELGLVGLVLLALFVAGAAGTARRAGREGAAASAALAAYALHAGLDWDWEMPALTLLALVLIARLAAEPETRT